MATQQQQQQPQQQPPPAVIQKYRQLVGECQKIGTKISELEMDKSEHALVEETLTPLDKNRVAYRLVGEALVQRTVGEVLPSVVENRENLEKTIHTLRDRLKEQQEVINEMRTTYNFQDGQM